MVKNQLLLNKEELTIFSESQPCKKCTFTNYEIEEQHVIIFKDGKLVYELPTTEEVRKYCQKQAKFDKNCQ